MKLENRVAIITGGAGAIGSATALAMAKQGADIVIADLRLTEAEEVAGQVRALGQRALAIQADVRNAADINVLVETTIHTFGKLDIMFNNAGLAVIKPATEHTDEDWDLVVDTDLKGVFYGCRAAGRVMLRQNSGVILNTASIVGLGGFSSRVAYSAAKAGIINLTRSLSSEWALDGVRVNAIAPGYILTEGLRRSEEAGLLDLNDMRRRTPMGHIGEPEDVALAAVFLSSEDARFITGVVLPVDGGYTAYSAPELVPSRPHAYFIKDRA